MTNDGEIGDVEQSESPNSGMKGSELAISLYDRLTGRNAEVIYEFLDMDVKLQESTEPIVLDGSVKITTKEKSDTSDSNVPEKFSGDEEPIESSENATIGEQLNPTPHTLWQFPKQDAEAFFYYFTDDMFVRDDSKYKPLDEELTLMGRKRDHLEVAIIERDAIRDSLWDLMIDGIGINNYPALVCADSELGVRDINMNTKNFTPNGNSGYAVLESGIISDDILSDRDQVRHFINDLYDSARNNSVKKEMLKEKIIYGISIAKGEFFDKVTIQESIT